MPGKETFVSVNGVRLWTKRHGRGRPMVLLHGGPGLWDDFDGLAAMIDDLVEVHRYDQRGCGRSGASPPYDVAAAVSDLDALRAHWGHKSWAVAGHSWGANLALAYAVGHPQRVDALIYIDGTGFVDDWRDEYHANADARLSEEQRARHAELRRARRDSGTQWTPEMDREHCVLSWMTDFADRDGAERRARSLLRPFGPNYEVNAAVNADWQRLTADSSFGARVARLRVPALVLHGAKDPRPVRLAERLAASVPDSRLVVIRATGHYPWLERPEAVRRALRDFLSR